MTNETPRIYVADLAAYNEGTLSGDWIDLEYGLTRDELYEKIQAILDKAPGICEGAKKGECFHEEWAIHDYENLPRIGEYEDLDRLLEISQAIHEHGLNVVKAYIDLGVSDDLSDISDRYRGTYKDEKDFAYDLVRELYDLDKMMGDLANYFDYEAFARDLFMGDYYGAESPEGLIVFNYY